MWLQSVLLVQRLAVQKPAKITVVVTSYHVTSHSDRNDVLALSHESGSRICNC